MKHAVFFLQKYRYVLLSALFVLQMFLIVYSQRGFLFKQYDVAYWKDRFEHSQWQLPLSQRILGDDGLFEYVGYTLVHGADPSLVNAETPPVGKYLIGTSIVLFSNPFVYTFFIGLATLFVFFFLSKKILKNTLLSALSTLLLFCDPLFFSQLSGGWVDSTQLFFLLLHFLLVFSLPKKQSVRFYALLILSGLALGLFAQSKTPILLPFIFILDCVYLLRILSVAVPILLVGFLLGDTLPYAYYFHLHHSFMDFIRLQKYIISFYTKSRLSVHHEAFWTSILFGQFPDIVTGVRSSISGWWLIWPVAFLLSIFVGVRALIVRKASALPIKLFAVFIFLSVLVFTFIPFYPRYFLILLPFVYLLVFSYVSRIRFSWMKYVLVVLIFLYAIVNTFIYLHPGPQDAVNVFSYNFSHGFFQDVYQEDIAKQSFHISREQFFLTGHTAFNQAAIRFVSIKATVPASSIFTREVTVPMTVVYNTQDLGSFTQHKNVHLVKEGGQWKIVWDWNLLLDHFVPGDMLKKTVVPGTRGSIIGITSTFAQDTQGYIVSVIPQRIDRNREQEMLKFFASLSGQKAVYIQNAYLENSLPSEAVPLFTTFSNVTDAQHAQLLSYPGVLVSAYPGRIYTHYPITDIQNTVFDERSTRIYSSSTYHGVMGLEKAYDRQLSGSNGGSLMLIDRVGNVVQTLINREPKNGQDVHVSL